MASVVVLSAMLHFLERWGLMVEFCWSARGAHLPRWSHYHFQPVRQNRHRMLEPDGFIARRYARQAREHKICATKARLQEAEEKDTFRCGNANQRIAVVCGNEIYSIKK